MRSLLLAGIACTALAIAQPRAARAASAQEAANLAATVQMFADFGQGNMDAVFALFSDDVVSTVYGSEGRIALHGTRTGKAAVMQWFADVDATFAPEEFAVDEYFADGDTVVCLMHESGTAKATGKHYSEHEVLFLTWSNGQIVQLRALDDSAEELRAMEK